MTPRIRFGLFAVLVLGVPGLLMHGGEAERTDLGKLALILGPAVFGNVLALGLGKRAGVILWRRVGFAALITLSIAASALAVSIGSGSATFSGPILDAPTALTALVGTCLTSVLEELGWALGGFTLAVRACGERIGIVLLGALWALWHLVPVYFQIGLFPELERAPPLMLVAFVLCCVAYRGLLSYLVMHANSWLAAAAGHLAPNLFITAFITSGLVVLADPAQWMLFPAPGGLLFLALVVLALLGLRARWRTTPQTTSLSP